MPSTGAIFWEGHRRAAVNRILVRALGALLLAGAVAIALIYQDRLDAAALTGNAVCLWLLWHHRP